MKTFDEILKDIESRNNHIKSLEAQVESIEKDKADVIEKYMSSSKFMKNENLESIHKKYNDYINEIAPIEKAIEKEKICIKYLENNARLSLLNDNKNIICEVWSKYEGKRHGPKTEEKIFDELKEKTGCYVYIHSGDIAINPINKGNKFRIECGAYNKCEKLRFLDNDNKVVKFDPELIKVFYINNTYFDDVDKITDEVYKTLDELREKEKARLFWETF